MLRTKADMEEFAVFLSPGLELCPRCWTKEVGVAEDRVGFRARHIDIGEGREVLEIAAVEDWGKYSYKNCHYYAASIDIHCI